MASTVSDFFWQRVHQWGVRRVFGYPGDGINGLIGALDRNTDIIEFVQSRHEELAAFMACAHAKFTGEVGVCLATSGPGAIHLLNGLYDAQARSSAGASQSSASRRAARSADIISRRSISSHCSRTWRTSTCRWRSTPVQVRHLIDRAIRIARSERAVTCIILPKDVQEMKAVETPPERTAWCIRASATARRSIVPTDADLATSRRRAQRGQAGGDAGGRRRAACDRRSDRGRRAARRRCGQGAARQGGAAGRPAFRDRLDRPARHASRATR